MIRMLQCVCRVCVREIIIPAVNKSEGPCRAALTSPPSEREKERERGKEGEEEGEREVAMWLTLAH